MAVDVPDSFIARNKTPPRYPPPVANNTQVSFNFLILLKNIQVYLLLLGEWRCF